MHWRPEERKDLIEVGGPIKRMTPRGLLLVDPDKRPSQRDPSIIECGKCHEIIYRTDKGFDANAFQAARKAHYSTSPDCEK
jgi:hypothetical protein